MELPEWHRWWKQRGESELRTLLMDRWDPIGVRDEPLAASEYDSYLGPLASKLRAGADAQAVATYLAAVEHDWMELATTPEQLFGLGATVVAWYADAMRTD